ncbi:type II toxin-antitoxin system HicB family antitoxin [Candidatus Spongiisocius sp.]|uniref:type II toxin-antitoxin system HicB family antitoxin n=1 Tax=Candidatus Spongiisocius sp. TaxID=3101273 RepID=UPI003B59F363
MTSPKIARWAMVTIANAEVEAISDPPGYFATVPVCRGAWACGSTREAAIHELEEALADWAEVPTNREPAHPYLSWAD